MKTERTWVPLVWIVVSLAAFCATPWIGRLVYVLVGGDDVEQWTRPTSRHWFAAMVIAMASAFASVISCFTWCVELSRLSVERHFERKEAKERLAAMRASIAVRQEPPGTPAPPPVGANHKPLNLSTDRTAMIEKAINADDGACSTGVFADEHEEAEYWAIRQALAMIAYETLATVGLGDSEKVAAFKKLAVDALERSKTPRGPAEPGPCGGTQS